MKEIILDTDSSGKTIDVTGDGIDMSLPKIDKNTKEHSLPVNLLILVKEALDYP